MMFFLASLLLLQEPAWHISPPVATVGDTVVLERVLPAEAGSTGRTAGLPAGELLEPLDGPAVVARDRRVVVRHTLAFFQPGVHRIPMPPVEIVGPDGHVEIVLGDTATVAIRSVLPDSGPRPAPQQSRPPLERPVRRIEPLVLLTAGVLLVLVLWGIARRRTRPLPAPPSDEADGETGAPPFMRWLSAGETRAVTTLAMDRIRAAIAEAIPEATRALDTEECLAIVRREQPEWPLDELEALVLALDRSRFAPLGPSDAAELADRTEELLPRLRVTEDVA